MNESTIGGAEKHSWSSIIHVYWRSGGPGTGVVDRSGSYGIQEVLVLVHSPV